MKKVAIVIKDDLTEEGVAVYDKEHNKLDHTHLDDWTLIQNFDRVVARKGNGFVIIADYGGKMQLASGTVLSTATEGLF